MLNQYVQTAINANSERVAGFIAQQAEYTAKISAVDPTAADAAAQVAAIVADRTAWRTETNDTITRLDQSMKFLIDNISVDEQAEAKAASRDSRAELGRNMQASSAAFTAAESSAKAAISAAKPEATIKSPEATNPSETDAAAAEKQATGTIEGTPPALSPISGATAEQVQSDLANRTPGIPSSMPVKIIPATPKFAGGKDHRVRLKVPVSYLVGQAAGPNNTLVKSQGIIFPYTPTIGQEYTAVYNPVPLVHTNYTQYFYKNSAVGTIALSAKFTVQNDYEAEVYFSILHLLRALTKMRWGDDDNAGSPPPVCRLFAYGDAIMNNVPVAISYVKVDLPDNVDYFTSKSLSSAPVLSTISITLTPIYSRNEQQQFTVSDYLSSGIRSKGYL
jgi:hypothetical protein